MKKLLFAIIFLSYTVPAFAQGTMKIVYANNIPPFFWESGGQMHGILTDVLTESIQTRMGIPVTHRGYPWARAQKNGKKTVMRTLLQQYPLPSAEHMLKSAENLL